MKKYALAVLALVVLALALMLLLTPGGPEHYIRVIFGWTDTHYQSPVGWKGAAVEAQVQKILALKGLGEERATPLEPKIFSQLPAFPPEFYRVELLNYYDRLDDSELAGLPESYWKQPEWYPGFDESGIAMMGGVNGTGAVYGYGAYKADVWRAAEPGQNFTAVIFLHASWGVKSYQGFLMSLDYNQSEFEDVRASPDIFLLTPTWPSFTQNWTQKVVLTGRVRPGAKNGGYTIAMRLDRPPEEWAAQWRDAYTYAEPMFEVGFGRPIFQLHLRVQHE
jgi:hypothetical protein